MPAISVVSKIPVRSGPCPRAAKRAPSTTLAMAISGALVAAGAPYWVLLVVALTGTLSTGIVDNGPATTLEQVMLAAEDAGTSRVYARYNAIGAAAGALGALAAALPALGAGYGAGEAVHGWLFVVLAPIGVAGAVLASRMSAAVERETPNIPASDRSSGLGGGLGPSRRVVRRMAALFAVDAGGSAWGRQCAATTVAGMWRREPGHMPQTVISAVLPRAGLAVVGLVGVLISTAGCGSSSAQSDTSNPAMATFASTGTSAAGATHRVVGLTLNPGSAGQDAATRLFAKSGATGLEAAEPWSALEPSPGRFDFSDVDSIVQGVASQPDDRVLMVVGSVETTHRSTPADLSAASWSSARLERRYHALVDALVPHFSRQIAYLSVGNEADVYLDRHPAEAKAYGAFVSDAIAYWHRKAPWLQVGVTTTFDGLTRHSSLARLGDVVIVTYYPLAAHFHVRAPTSPATDIPRLVAAAGGRPIVVQEAGYPTASRLGSSDAAQARFVDALFQAWNAAAAHIPFLDVFSMHDFAPSWCRSQIASYGLPGNLDGQAYLCSLGLRHHDGSPKPAWARFAADARQVR